jgi:hypothetical protein
MDLILPSRSPLPSPDLTRKVSLNEEDSETLPDVGPESALLGTVDLDSMPGMPMGMPMMWILISGIGLGDTEVWDLCYHGCSRSCTRSCSSNREVFDPMLPGCRQVRPPEAETG